MAYLGIDIGGTFTDFALWDAASGRIRLGKRLTTPQDLKLAVLQGAESLMAAAGLNLSSAERIIHGTTVVANALIERRGVRTGLLTTRGFRDALEIGREIRYDLFAIALQRPEPLVPRFLRLGLAERIASDGAIVMRLDPLGVREAVSTLVEHGVRSVAVCFLHSPRNPVHEYETGKLIAREYPELDVSLSAEICPELREYERTSTTVINAYVRPLTRAYLEALEGEFRTRGARAHVYIMLSSGCLATPEVAARFPVRLIESGPAGGVLAASLYSRLAGCPQAIGLDMGGTTTKICLLEKGVPRRASEFEVARVQRFMKGSGLPVKVPTIEMLEIGAGGGSVGWVDPLGLPRVGPRSAGAEPGPACYGRGGEEPTVTDADLTLGYLNPTYFLGGEMPLDAVAARRALERKFDVGGGGAIEASGRMLRVLHEDMAAAIRIHAAERGRDAQRYALIAFGGAGPVHAYEVARRLGISRIVVPLGAGVTSALGFLAGSIRVELARGHYGRLDAMDWGSAAAGLSAMEEEALALLTRAGVDPQEVTVERLADMRYVGQGYEVLVKLPAGELGPSREKEILAAFREEYTDLYGRCLDGVPLELICWRLTASGPAPDLDPRGLGQVHNSTQKVEKGKRRVYFEEAENFVECSVLDRYALRPGFSLDGPAIIEERESTLVLGPRARGHVDNAYSILVDLW